MPDIAMCLGEGCPAKKDCYRHTAKPNEFMQSYGDFKYGEDGCEYFWPNQAYQKRVAEEFSMEDEED